MPPPEANKGESKFGFTVRQRVEVVKDDHFKGWHGHVRTFNSTLVAVDLDEPPPGHSSNGQWFGPENLRKAPLNIIVKYGNHHIAQFQLERRPWDQHEIALRSESDDPDWGYDGVYRLSHVGQPPTTLANNFQWEVQLDKVRNLRESDKPVFIDYYPRS